MVTMPEERVCWVVARCWVRRRRRGRRQDSVGDMAESERVK